MMYQKHRQLLGFSCVSVSAGSRGRRVLGNAEMNSAKQKM